MASTTDDFLTLNLEWAKEAIEIQAEHRKALQNARDEMEMQLRDPGADSEKITNEFFSTMDFLEEERKSKREACDKKFFKLIEELQDQL